MNQLNEIDFAGNRSEVQKLPEGALDYTCEFEACLPVYAEPLPEFSLAQHFMLNPMEPDIRTSRLFNLLSALLAFLVWGGWAFVMNSSETTGTGIIAALTQGTASFMMTLFMVQAVTFLFHRFERPLVKVVLPAILVNCLTTVFLVNVHTLMGTPRVLATIAPALTVAFSFCLLTAWKLHRLFQQRTSTQYE